jgi:signal transduction histidine kinase
MMKKQGSTMQKKRILFIDDEVNVLNAMRRILRGQRDIWEMDFYSSVDEALARMEHQSYDTVLSDVMMPGKSGLDLLKIMKSDPETADVPVIILTGLQQTDLKRQALELGAVDLLNKPVQGEDLEARIRSVLKIKSYQDELRDKNQLLEDQLLQARKMEMIGVLAAGAFHDMNNVLAIISSYTQLAQLSPDSLEDCVGKIDESIELASEFMSQILSFSRPQQDTRELCDISLLVSNSLKLIRRCVSRRVEIRWTPVDVARVNANQTQLFQIILNLCINASHAIESGGTIVVSLEDVQLSAAKGNVLAPTVEAGDYVRIAIADSGNGMDEATIQNLFSPFFSKQQNVKGTGLGLSIVHRIVETHAGGIEVASNIGDGTTFYVYLPTAADVPGGASSL